MKPAEMVHLGLRKIGSVQVFDLGGMLTGDDVDAVAQKIDQVIQRKRLRRVILNFQKVFQRVFPVCLFISTNIAFTDHCRTVGMGRYKHLYFNTVLPPKPLPSIAVSFYAA